jgi:hypothetical protein
LSVFEVREELHAVVAAAALLPCICCQEVTCIPCRARTLQAEILARGIRIRRWRNDPSNVPRSISHVAGVVDVQREPRRSCPRYIVDRAQACARCGEPLAVGKWALFFSPGESVTKLLGRDGAQLFAQPARPGGDSISCAEFARIKTGRADRSHKAAICGMICIMTNRGVKGEPAGGARVPIPRPYPPGRTPFGWHRTGNVITVDPIKHATRSTIFLMRQQGLTYSRIARILNAAGRASSDGGTWMRMSVRRVVVIPLPQWLVDHLATAPDVIELVIPAPIENNAERMENKEDGINHNNPFESIVA